MQIDILSAVPDLMQSPFQHSIMKRAQDKQILQLQCYDLHHFSFLPHQKIDDYPYGGGAGMVLRADVLAHAIQTLTQKNNYDEIIYFAPDGQHFHQNIANAYALKEKLLLICGHYKGIDQRIRDRYITREISMGPFVVSGGELPACLFADAVVRLIPGVLGDESAALTDSFQDNMIAPPVYTRPAVFEDMKVPDILLSGHHKAIQDWELTESLNAKKKYRQRNQNTPQL